MRALDLHAAACQDFPAEDMAVVVKAVLGSHFGVGKFTTHFSLYFSGDWDVHWGYDLDFGLWPHFVRIFRRTRQFSTDPQGLHLSDGAPFRRARLS